MMALPRRRLQHHPVGPQDPKGTALHPPTSNDCTHEAFPCCLADSMG